MKILELRGVKKRYHANSALNGIDLSIEKGNSLTVLGPNGSGKTTLLKILSGIMSPTEGKVIYKNNQASENDRKKEIFFLGHKNSLYNSLTVLENVNFVCRLFSRNNGDASVENILREYGLWERRNDPVGELSQGMKRRLAIAKGFLIDPDVFIMDEPFSGLDIRWRSSTLSKIKDFKRQKKSLILSTHLVVEGYELADYIAFLHRGKFLFIKKKEEVDIEEINGLFDSPEETLK
ncbi:MAG: heme ABC exporter ATP-binding protein CcmA [Nitrospiraceae bacterium]|jgi:heme ABC exporter ATP-binding subunit CcmA|nr:MAG: heme ABC exporter ATP-binding protein CcmA [Nitrospiraceae bacterium]